MVRPSAGRIRDSLPVTVPFSDAVGEILVNNAKTDTPRPYFNYYIWVDLIAVAAAHFGLTASLD